MRRPRLTCKRVFALSNGLALFMTVYLTVFWTPRSTTIKQPWPSSSNKTHDLVTGPESDKRHRHLREACRRIQQVSGGWSGLLYSNFKPSSRSGLVDRLKGSVLAFLISLATQRKFTLSLGLGCEEAFQEIFDQGCIKWKDNKKLINTAYFFQWQTAELYMGFKDDDDSKRIIKQMSTTDLLSLGGWPRSNFLEMETNGVYYDAILRNPRYHDRLVQLLGLQNTSGEDINFRTLGMLLVPMLYQPRPQIQQQIRSLIRKGRSADTKVGLICAQFRLRERDASRPLCDASCVQRAFHFLRESGKQWNQASFFLASDEASISSRFQQECPECDVIRPNGRLGHVGHESRGDCSATRRAAWEIAVLGECDVLLLSRASSFARVSYLLRRNTTQVTCFLDHFNSGTGCVQDEEALRTAYS